MKQRIFTLSISLLTCLCSIIPALALNEPSIPACVLTDGGTYVMMNRVSPKWYMTRTSWDGAIYLTPEENAYKSIAFTAHRIDVATLSDSIKQVAKEASGIDYIGNVWYFSLKDSCYVGNNDVSGNIGNTNYITTPYYWIINSGDTVNSYDIRSYTRYQSLDLNAEAQYFVLFSDESSDRAFAQNKWMFLTVEKQTIYIAQWNLYNEIEVAKKTNTTSDQQLTAAITTATSAYETLITADEIAAANKILKTAVDDYNTRINGDITNKLTNPSFEDLTAQNGQTTTSIANAPIGWNIKINGVLCNTSDKITAAGLTAWCGVNTDGDAATKDGSYIFGIWNQNTPEFEISQTVTKLPHGTYLVSCGLMGSKTSSYSRLTTQRVFANNNSTYYGHVNDYSAANLASDEIVSFAEYDEIQGDASTLNTCTATAYVFNDSLTLGVRTNGLDATGVDNGGGRGWFKCDNFKLAFKGYSKEDAINALNTYIERGKTIQDATMQSSLSDSFIKLMEDAETYATSSTTTADGIDNMIQNVVVQTAKAKVSITAYTKFSKALQDASENLSTFQDLSGIYTYSDLYDKWEATFDSHEIDADSITSVLKEMATALEELKRSGVKENTDITNLLTNPSFETDNYTGWTVTTKSLTWCGVNTDGDAATKDGNNIFGIWNGQVPNFELSQTISGLQGGYYKITCGLMGSSNGSGSRMTTQRLFANNYVQYYGAETDYNATALDSLFPKEKRTFGGYAEIANDASTLEPMEVTAAINTGDSLKLGIRTSGDLAAVNNRAANSAGGDGWFKCDNFKLICVSLKEGASINNTNSNMVVTSTELYNINGMKLNKLHKGIIIMKYNMADGSVRVNKIVVK
jgi:hypothetical protein